MCPYVCVCGYVVCVCGYMWTFLNMCEGDDEVNEQISLLSFSSGKTYSPPSPGDHNAISRLNITDGTLQNVSHMEDNVELGL